MSLIWTRFIRYLDPHSYGDDPFAFWLPLSISPQWSINQRGSKRKIRFELGSPYHEPGSEPLAPTPMPFSRSCFLSTVTWKSASSQNLSVQVKEEAKYNEWLRRQALAEEEEEERRNAARKLDLHRQLDAQVVEKSQNVFEQKADVREERQAVDNIIQQVLRHKFFYPRHCLAGCAKDQLACIIGAVP